MGVEFCYHHHTLGLLWHCSYLLLFTIILWLLHIESSVSGPVLEKPNHGFIVFLHGRLRHRPCSHGLLHSYILPVHQRRFCDPSSSSFVAIYCRLYRFHHVFGSLAACSWKIHAMVCTSRCLY